MAWRIVRATDHRVMPWKNGGGSTAEIAIGPDGASVAGGFDWRLSIAQVASDGPFSAFPGFDRLITLLDGKGMILTLDGRESHALDRAFEPFAFSGDRATACRLVDGACEDLNLMVARERLVYRAALLRPEAAWLLGAKDATRLLFLFRGKAAVTGADGTASEIGARDTLLAGPGDDAPAIAPDRAALALHVALSPASGPARQTPGQAAER